MSTSNVTSSQSDQQLQTSLSTITLTNSSKSSTGIISSSHNEQQPTTTTTSINDENPFDRGTFIAVTATIGSYFFAINLIYPFAAFMVADFFPNRSDTELGYYVGYLESSFYVGCIIASIIWARLADKYGRRPIVLCGLFGTCLSATLYGLSVNYPMAVTTRLIWGFWDANLGISKTIIGEIATPSNQARLYSVFGVTGGVARLFGNLVGGWTADININVPKNSFWYIFDKFPYLLPCLISSFTTLIGIIMVIVLLKETKKFKVKSKDKSENSKTKTKTKKKNKNKDKYREIIAINTETDVESNEIEMAGMTNNDTKENINRSNGDVNNSGSIDENRQEIVQLSTFEILKMHNVWVCSGFYGIMSILGAGINATFCIWVLNSKKDFGFGWKEAEIGTVFAIIGPIYTLSQLFIYPKFVKKLGFVFSTKLCLFLLGVTLILLPHLAVFRHLPQGVVMTIVTIHMGAGFIVRVFAFTNTFCLVNNAGDNSIRATTNGITQTVGSIGRILAPSGLCNLFAWSCNNGLGWPFNYVLTFYVQGLICFAGAAWLYLLPKDYEEKIQQANKNRRKRMQNIEKQKKKNKKKKNKDGDDESNMSLVSVTASPPASATSSSGSSDSTSGGMINYGIKAMDSQFGLLDPKSPARTPDKSNVFEFQQADNNVDREEEKEKEKENAPTKQSKTQRVSQFLQKKGKKNQNIQYEKL